EFVNPNVLGHQLLNGRAVYWGSPLYGGRGVPFVRSIYPGLLMTLLAIAGMIAGVRGRRVTGIVVALSIVLALGGHTPLWRLLYKLGLARSVRYPEKFILMGLFALIVFGALTLDRILANDEGVIRAAKRTATVAFLVLMAIALFAMTPFHAPLFLRVWNPNATMVAEMLPASRSSWSLASVKALALFVLMRNVTGARRPVWLALVGALVLFDLGVLVPEIAPRMPRAYFEEEPRIATAFKARHSDCRLLHVAAWQPGGAYQSQRAGLYETHRAAMYPMMPASWGIPTVIEPDLERSSLLPSADFVDAVWAMSKKDPWWLEQAARAANVCAVAVFNQPPNLDEPVRLIDLPPSPRYSMHFGVVRGVRETPNTARIDVDASGNDALYMSVTPHKYWRVTVDGRDAAPRIANIGFQSVDVPAGRHLVEMRYRNPLFAIGGAVSIVTALALLGLGIRAR
ncbi:MAG TPA: YfhO family protein, partial [Thermoanaerobaculia bacterium]|nr:YfhO family protein [Thermoanaerobaculia bacterium]